MENAKPWWQSKAMIGAALTLVAGVLKQFGVELPEGIDADSVYNIVMLIGGLLALVGRAKADITPIRKSLL